MTKTERYESAKTAFFAAEAAWDREIKRTFRKAWHQLTDEQTRGEKGSSLRAAYEAFTIALAERVASVNV
jgi:hypothetical protein